MSNSISFETAFGGFVDGGLVAAVSRTHDSDGPHPYVVELSGLPAVLTTESVEDACQWLKALTILSDKAIAFDGIFEDEDGDGEGPVPFDDGRTVIVTPDVVDVLTDAVADTEWVDDRGEHYKVINGEWYVSYHNGTTPWKLVEDEGPEFLTDYGPYTSVGPA